MDMIYSYPDVLSYVSLRHPVYTADQYEIRGDALKQGKLTKNAPKKTTGDSCKTSKETCPICQERQRRPLAKYIQQKSREERVNDASILEEEETDQEAEKKAAK